MKAKTKRFEIVVNGKPVQVTATAYEANDKTRYRVSYNGGPVHIFGWDVNENRLMVIDSASEKMPIPLESAIAEELQHKMAA